MKLNIYGLREGSLHDLPNVAIVFLRAAADGGRMGCGWSCACNTTGCSCVPPTAEVTHLYAF